MEKGRLKRCIISRGNTFMAFSTMVGIAKKVRQFGIFVFVEVQVVNVMEITSIILLH